MRQETRMKLSKSQKDIIDSGLFNDIRKIIEQARMRVAVAANSETALLYWHIGERINRDMLNHQRADYKIVSPVATQLSWSHFTEVLPLKDGLQREFYLTMAGFEGWSNNT